MRKVKISVTGKRVVKIMLPSEVRIELEIAKIMTGQDFGATIVRAYRFAKRHGFKPARQAAQ